MVANLALTESLVPVLLPAVGQLLNFLQDHRKLRRGYGRSPHRPRRQA